jgi:PAS domain S-box-containing protein
MFSDRGTSIDRWGVAAIILFPGASAMSTVLVTDSGQMNLAWFVDFCEYAYDLIQCVGTEGQLLYVNRSWRETLEYTPEEVKQLRIWSVISPECRDHCAEAFQGIMRGESLNNVEVIFQTKSGVPVYLEGCATLCAEPGFVVHTRGIFRNITERKKMEAAREKLIADLQKALAEIRTLQGLLPICAWCKKVRDDKNFWLSVEDYLSKNTDVRITHGMCPSCLQQTAEALKKQLAAG